MIRWYTLLLVAPFFFQNLSLFAQQPAQSVQFSGRQLRAPLALTPGQNRVTLCGLTPGETYSVISVAHAQGQKADFQTRLASPSLDADARAISRADRPAQRRFVAKEACVDIDVTAATAEAGATSVPMYLSVQCESCPNEWLEGFIEQAPMLAPNLSTTGGIAASSLVTNTLIGGNCFDVSGITSAGNAASRGTFTNGQSSINLQNGVVLCTGNVNILPGPNNSNSAGGGFGVNSTDDTDLATLTGGNQYDVSKIEFNFTPTADVVTFEFVFGSEEYCEYVNSNFNDVFGFFISGPGISGTQNIALIPGTSTPVAINNVNHLTNSTYYVNNNNYGGGPGPSCAGEPVYNSADCQLDGWTVVLTATANVTACQTYHIKLAIADIADAIYASAVFLKANSFDAGGTVKSEAIYPAGQSFVYEGCDGGFIRFIRQGGDINVPLVIGYAVGGTATVGDDYAPFPNPITIPAGQTQIDIPIEVFADLIVEGQESIIIHLENPCSCTADELIFLIGDKPPLEVELNDQTLCGSSSATISPTVTGGLNPLAYQWSTGATTPSINVNTPGTNTYTVTVTDNCGTSNTASATVTIEPAPTANLSGTGYFCEGVPGSVNLTLTLTGLAPWDVTYNTPGGPVTETFFSSPAIITVTDPGNYSLVSVSSQNGCTGTVTGNATLIEYNVNLNLNPNDPACFSSTNGSVQATASGGTPAYTYVWNTGASGATLNNVGPGTYTVTVTDNKGCTEEETVTLTAPPQLTANATINNNIDCNTPSSTVNLDVNGGTPTYDYNWNPGGSTQAEPTFTAGGTYTVTVTDDNNCTTTATVTIAQNTTLPVAAATFTGQITCTTTDITINGNGSSQGPEFTYDWSGPGIVSGDNTLNPVVNLGGSYTLTVTNNVNGCTKTVTVTIPQNNTPPVAVANTPPNITCTTPTISINGTGSTTGAGITYQWTTSDGNIVGGANTLNPQVNLAGTYTLVVTNTNNGCTDDATVTVNGNIVPPTVTINPPGIVNCYTPTIEIDADATSSSGNVNYTWSASGGGNITGGGNTDSPDVNAAGTYTVTVTDPANNCTSTATVTVTSNLTQPIAVAAPPAQLTCQFPEITLDGTGSSTGPNFTYDWGGPNLVSGQNTLNPVVDGPGAYTLTVTNTDNGCTKTVTVNVSQNANVPNAVANAPLNISCTNPTVSINGNGSSTGANFTYQWTTADGNIVGGANTLNPQVNQAGTYTILVTNTANGCTNEATVTVNGNTNLPTVTINPPGVVNCYTPTIEIEADGNSSNGNVSYTWSASGGGNITGGGNTDSPDVNAAGTYTVTVTDPANNCTSTATVTVTASLTPPVAVAAPPAQLTCQFPEITLDGTGSSTGPNFTYDWGGPNLVSGQNTLNPVVDGPGAYTLTVTNTDNGCTKTVTVNVSQNANVPNAVANAPLNISCTNPTVSISGVGSSTGANFTFVWSTTDGNFTGGTNTLTPTVNQAGTYTILVTNTTNGCTNEASVTVNGNVVPPTVTINPPGIVDCYTPSIDLQALGISSSGNVNYTWSASGGGVITGGGNTDSPSVNAAGNYTVTVTDPANNCTSTATVAVTANLTQPIAVATPPATLTCQYPEITINANGSSQGPEFTYDWSGPGLVSGENTLNPVVDAPGSYTLTVTNTTNGCTKTVTVNVGSNQNFPFADIAPPILVNCVHPTIQLQGSASSGPNFSFNWSATPGNFVSGQNTLTPTVNEAGFYTLLVINLTNGCSSEVTVEVEQNFDTPDAIIATPGELNCYTPEIDLDATNSNFGPNDIFQWTTTNGVIVSNGDTPSPTINDDGTYNLLITNPLSGCTDQAQVIVTENFTQPAASAGPSSTLTCLAPLYTLNGSGSVGPNFTYLWSGPGIVSGDNTLNPVVDEPGTYILTVTDLNNGCTKTSSVTINSNQIYPNAFAQPPGELNCAVSLLTLSGIGSTTGANITYQWTANPGNIFSGATTLQPKVNEAGFYTLVVTNTANGCTDEVEVFVDADIAYPDINIAPPLQLNCNFLSVDLDASGSSQGNDFDYDWTTTNGNIIGGNSTPIAEVDEPGTYLLTITNEDNFCTTTASIVVTQDLTPPTAVAASTGTLTCQFPQVELSGQGSSENYPFYYEWTTVNGNIVAGQGTLNPTVNQPGTYTLTVFNGENGCTSTAAATVVTSQTFPTASAVSPGPLTCANAQITLDGSGSSQGAQYAYVWSTTNGNIVSGGNTINPIVNQPGTYQINVLNTQTGCATTATVIVDQNIAPPAATAAPGGILSCTVSSLTLSGTGSSAGAPFAYNWTTPDGNILSGQNTLNPVVNAVGSYTLVVTNQTNGCTSSATTTVGADASLPVSSAGAPSTLTCAVEQLILNGNASSQGLNFNYGWNGPGILNGGATLTPTIDAPGVYELLVTNTSNGCTALSSVTIPEDVALPQAEAGPVAQINCFFPTLTLDGTASSNGANFTYAWTTVGGNFVSGQNTPSPVINQPGLYNLLITNTQNGCTATDNVNISQNTTPPTVDAGPNGLITCTNATVTLAATGSTGAQFSYQWTTPNGNIASGPNSLNPVVDAPGTYNLLITNTQTGCTATDVVTVNKDANVPTALATVPGELNCIVPQIQLNGTTSTQGPTIQFTWSTTNGNFSGGQNTLTPTVNQPGQYTLTIFNTANNCEAVSTVTVDLNLAPPMANAGTPAIISCVNPVLTLDGNGSSQGQQYVYQWNTTNGEIISGENTLNPQVDQSGFYTLVVTDQTNGCTAESTVQILLDQNTPEADAGPQQLLTCTVSSLQLNGTASSIGPNFVYQWTASGGGNIVSGANGLTPTVDEPGLYTLLVSNPQNGCTAEESVAVTENVTLPVASAGPSPTLNCAVLQTPLSASANTQGAGQLAYYWTTVGGNILSGQTSLTPLVNQPGMYNLLVTNTLTGCTTTSSVQVLQNVFYPVVDAGPTAVLTCLNTTNTLAATVSNAGPSFQPTWTTLNGNFVSGQNTLNPVVNASGIYTLVVTNPDNFCTATDQVVITQDAGLPVATAGTGPTLTCSVTSAPLDAAGSSVGAQFTYQWSTLDGSILSGGNTLSPVVGEPGTYLLTVLNTQNSCQSVSSVVVGQNIVAPTALTGGPVTLTCTDASLQLSGAGSSTGSQYSYLWTTTDGQILSGTNTLTPTIGEPGSYTLQVTDQVNGCASTALASVLEDVNAPLAAAATPGELTCQITTLTLTGAGSSLGNQFDYQWIAGPGGLILNGAATLSPVVSEPGTYTILVTNTDNGCTETAAIAVAENINPPAVNAGPDTEVTCADPQISLSAIGAGGIDGVSYAWTSAGGGNIVSGANTPNPVVDAGGTYNLLVTDLYNGCTATDNLIVTPDQAPPVAAIALPNQLTCAVLSIPIDGSGSSTGVIFEYAWSGPGLVSGVNTLTPTVNLPGLYILEIINTDNGCASQQTTTVLQNVQPPQAEAGNGFELTCSVEEDELSAQGSSAGPNFIYVWTTADGNILGGQNSATPLVNAVGTYNLLVTDTQNGCTATDLTIVTENTNYPSALELATELPACGGQPGAVTFTEVTGGVGPYLYSIDNGENFLTANQFGDLDPGTYPLVVQDVNGCEYDQTLTFPVPVEPAVGLDPEIEIQFGETTTLTAAINIPIAQVQSVVWSPMDGLTPTANPLVMIAQPFNDMEYTVTIVNVDGCVATDRVIIRVDEPAIWAPNAISPNINDGVNDEFLIWAKDNTVRNIRTLQIYDRWGNQVFQNDNLQPNDPKLGWDGTFRGQVMNPAVFVWWAEIELVSGQVILMKGDVTIVQ